MANVIISGANRGIGLALAKQYLERGDQVIALCRKASAALTALGAVVVDDVDVTDQRALAGLPARIRAAGFTHIDILINNAGVLSRQTLGDIDADAVSRIARQFHVNAIGPLLISQMLVPMMRGGAKLAIVTSRMGSLADNTSGGAYGYRMSKAAANAAGRSLAVDLAEHGVAVALLHPGYVRTDMTDGKGLIDAPESAAGMIAVLDKLDIENSGQFWHSNGERLPW